MKGGGGGVTDSASGCVHIVKWVCPYHDGAAGVGVQNGMLIVKWVCPYHICWSGCVHNGVLGSCMKGACKCIMMRRCFLPHCSCPAPTVCSVHYPLSARHWFAEDKRALPEVVDSGICNSIQFWLRRIGALRFWVESPL